MIKGLCRKELLHQKPPLIPIPFQDEILSSWIARLAYANQMHPKTFLNTYLGLKHRDHFKNCLDAHISDEILNCLQTITSPHFTLKNMTLKSYAGILREGEIKELYSSYLDALQFCPQCLNEDIPYYKKSWHINLLTICAKHHCFLYDACPQCQKPIKLLSMYHNAFDYTFCSYCGYDLKKAPIKRIGKKHTLGILANQKLAKIIEDGYIQLGESIAYSFCFVDTITQLSKLILLRRNFAFIHNHPLFKLLENRLKSSLFSKQPTYSQLTVVEKYALFGLIMYLFEDYPNHFSQFITMNHLTHWGMMKDLRYKAFWYENLVNNITPRYIAFGNMVTEEEVKNAIKYLKQQKIPIIKANLQRLFHNRGFFDRLQLL